MNLPSLVSLLSPPNEARFSHYEAGFLWYEIFRYYAHDVYEEGNHYAGTGFTFPVPAAQADGLGGKFHAVERAGLMMKWVRAHHVLISTAAQP